MLISTGATFEKVDEFRVITNLSSGKTGVELAREAYIRGADVTLICGQMSVDVPHVFDVIHVESVIDMQEAVRNRVPSSDVFISAAAVSDFRPAKDGAINKFHPQKI